jgi:hypothetical protein
MTMWAEESYHLRLASVKQNKCLNNVQTERFDQMNETSASSSSLSAIQALGERIESCTSWLHVLEVVEHPFPYLKVRDTVNGNIVGFSSEADYSTYVGIVSRQGAKCYA